MKKNIEYQTWANEHAPALRPWLRHEVERPVGHLLAYARLAKTLHGLRHGIVGRKKKILAVVVVSLSADLYVLAMVAMVLIAVDVLIILIHNCIVFYPQMEGCKRCIVLFRCSLLRRENN